MPFDRKGYMKKYLKIYRKKNTEKIRQNDFKYKSAHKHEIKEKRGPYREKNLETIRQQVWRQKLKWRYGITPEQYVNLLAKNNGECQICKTKEIRLSIDHDHKTKKIRGVLCGNCNRGIGLFRDSPAILKKAIYYLENHHGKKQ